MTTEPAFVGAGRHAVVTGLVAAFDGVREGGPARWIALEAPSGWGKTRVLREFYRRLASDRQPTPPYWPADILGDGAEGSTDVAARRKRLVPDVIHTPGSLPGYLWWGVTCSRRGGAASAALRNDLAQVQAHAEYLEDAWREMTSSGGRWRAGLKDAGIVAADEVAMEAAGSAVESVLGAAIPGLGLVRWLGERGIAGVRAAAQRRERLASATRLEASDLVAETASMLRRLAVPALPVVIAIEDAHAADPALCELVAALVTSDASVLVVSTSWPGASADNDDVQRALAAAGDRVVRLDHRSVAAPEPFGPDASLAELDGDALASIVRHTYPHVDEATLAAIVARYPNPLMLELFCQLPRVRRRGRSGGLRLDAATVVAAPAEIRGLYQELWNELPETVREALSLAALGIPSLLDPTLMSEWNVDLVLAALGDIDWPSLDDIADALHSGSDAYSWARSVSSMLRTFNEPDQRDIAAADDSFLFDDDRVEVRSAIGAALGAYLSVHLGDLGPAERHHIADLAVVLHAEGLLTDPDTLADAVRPAAELTWADQRDLPRTVAMLSRVIDAAPSADRLARAHVLRGHAHSLAGRPGAALADAGAAASPDAPDLFQIEILNLRARALGQLRRDDDAVEAYRELVQRVQDARGADHADTIASRANLAMALDAAGGGDALDLMRTVVTEAESVLGSDDLYMLSLRNSLATMLSNRDAPAEASTMFVELYADCHRFLGDDHPRTLNVARNLGLTLLSSGRPDEATQWLRTTAEDHLRVFGPDHPDTLRAQRFLGLALAQASDTDLVQEGVDTLVALHAREVDLLGWDHLDVQETRRIIARVASAHGDHDLAIDTLRRCVADAERVYGRVSVPVAALVVDLGRALFVAGREAEARDEWDRLAAEVAQSRGGDDPIAVQLRQLSRGD